MNRMELIGKTIAGRYEIKRLIDEGGMAYIYKAYCRRTKKDVAVKILKEEHLDQPQYIENFKNEIKASFKLSHKYIVKTIDAGVDGDIYYMVMELVDGITLKKYLKHHGALDMVTAVNLTKKLCEALSYAHSKGYIHKDIKPENIMITRKDKQPVIMDFGIAQKEDEAKESHQIEGSMKYIAPEQIKGSELDRRVDIYALGIILYEMLTGKEPFHSDSKVSLALKHIHEKPVEPKEIVPELPESLNRIVLKAISKQKEKRYSTAFELKKDLDKYLRYPDGRYVNIDLPTVDEIQLLEEEKAQAKSKRGYIIAGVVVLGVLATILIISMIFTISPRETNTANDVTMPNLLTIEEERAVSILETLGLTAVISYDDIGAHEGCVVAQEPQEGSALKRGDSVKITVCQSNDQMVVMPNVVGMSLSSALETLSSRGINNVEIVENLDSTVQQPDAVIEQSVEEGVQVSQKEQIILMVNKREEVETAAMPELRGLTLAEAISELSSQGMNQILIYEEVSDKLDVVIDQNPAQGSTVAQGATISLWVGSSPANFTAEYPLNLTNVPANSLIQITANVREGKETVEYVLYENRTAQDSAISQTVPLQLYLDSGSQRVELDIVVYVNNEVITTDTVAFTK